MVEPPVRRDRRIRIRRPMYDNRFVDMTI